MLCAGIVAEYNPFHNGHEYHIEQTRQLGATHIAAVMSGNFTQRGQGALIPKAQRVRAALMCGVDLVIELPCAYAVASAQRFAHSAVSLLNALGCVDILSFGSESGDTDSLLNAAAIIDSEQFSRSLQENISSGISYPLARQRALNQTAGQDIALSPNDTLGIEYILSLKRLQSLITPVAIARNGAMHDSYDVSGIFASASYIREIISGSDYTDSRPDAQDNNDYHKISSLMPGPSFDILNQCLADGSVYCHKNASRSILTALRYADREYLLSLPDVSEGLENRILSALQSAQDLDELYSLIKTKRYTHARIRRIITAAYLGITSDLQNMPAPYIRVLGANKRGREMLALSGKRSSLPIIGTMSALNNLPAKARRLFELECRAYDLYGMLTNSILPCNIEQRLGVINI